MMRLKLQKLDRRMSGHQWFKYRVEFPLSAFTDKAKTGFQPSAYHDRTQTFTDIMWHLTKKLGFGPYVDYTGFAHEPKWAFRIADSRHLDTIYLTEEARLEYDTMITFLTIKNSG